MINLVDSPFFVDSRFTSGIQIADMCASVIRIHHENELYRGVPTGADFLSAISRYCSTIREKSRDLEAPDGIFTWYGFDRMPERLHYGPTEPEEEYLSEKEATEKETNEVEHKDT